MWQVDNKTPFAHHGGAFRDHTGASFWSVWVAATFLLRNGRPPLFTLPQPPVSQEPRFFDDDPEGVLISDGEVTPPRARIDLTFRGSAPETLDRDRVVRLRLGDWKKRLTIRADRDEPGPIRLDGTTALWDDALPTGRLRDARPGPRVTVKGCGPAALGPVPRHWPQRADKGGTYDTEWQRNRAPLLPTDLDPAFWQTAPRDQQLDRPLPPGVTLELGGLRRTGPTDAPSSWPLPQPRFRTATRVSGTWHQAEAELQSIAVDLDAGLVRLVYQAVWPIPRASDDVLIERTLIALDDAGGFRVRPADAPLFDPAASLKEAPA
ncbi:DUF2169 domain-containing protein [Jannaschia sp. CCS1]|uniref:DUF2169 domain-containing protein n=1 Tax=Jannaschia sp. (strain CCS1) TaxID=290400 RepID=UPI000053C996|nr:DUF2169 domain-containing protein [Jannaschia sp. CCS1]ABD55933.1 hypothetical protein Jann_3016 [Jannaschia sp. CCS1]